MNLSVVAKVSQSLELLAQALGRAREGLLRLEKPRPDLVERIDCYEEVLAKQRLLAQSMEEFARAENWGEVRRHVDLIRGSSFMIQFDCQSLLAALAPGAINEPERQVH